MTIDKTASPESGKNRSRIIRLTVSGLMILVGTVVYISSRESILFFDWIPTSAINVLRSFAISDASLPGYFMVYCLPDGLWYGALLLFQSVLLRTSFGSRCIYLISILLPFAWETLQFHDDIPGTFDPMDLLIYILTLLIFLICFKRHKNYHEQE